MQVARTLVEGKHGQTPTLYLIKYALTLYENICKSLKSRFLKAFRKAVRNWQLGTLQALCINNHTEYKSVCTNICHSGSYIVYLPYTTLLSLFVLRAVPAVSYKIYSVLLISFTPVLRWIASWKQTLEHYLRGVYLHVISYFVYLSYVVMQTKI